VKVLFRESFAKDLKALRDKDSLVRIKEVLGSVQAAESTQQISNIRKLRNTDNCYRIRIGQYRIGLIIEKGEAIFIRCLHRRDIYRYFP
jgi:mRNA interferase RelE/StbE